MKHKPMTDEQLAALGLMEDGIYDFEVIAAENKVSSKGNDMMEIKLNVFDSEGEPRSKRDWIMPQMAKKFKHFHNACDIMDKYNAGTLEPEDVIGKTGKLMIKTEPYTNKDGLQVMSNKIDDYVKRDNLEAYSKASSKAAGETLEGDDIPF